jgi:hypothetical protein
LKSGTQENGVLKSETRENRTLKSGTGKAGWSAPQPASLALETANAKKPDHGNKNPTAESLKSCKLDLLGRIGDEYRRLTIK